MKAESSIDAPDPNIYKSQEPNSQDEIDNMIKLFESKCKIDEAINNADFCLINSKPFYEK